MWKYLWSEHRSHIYAAAGAILFLLSGMAVTFLSSNSGSGRGDIPIPGRQHLLFIAEEDVKEDFRVQSSFEHHFSFAETGISSLSNKSKGELTKDIHIQR